MTSAIVMHGLTRAKSDRWQTAREVARALEAAIVPATSFVFQWPLLFAVAGTAVWLRAGKGQSVRVDLALTLMLVPATFFWSYVAYSLFVMIGAS